MFCRNERNGQYETNQIENSNPDLKRKMINSSSNIKKRSFLVNETAISNKQTLNTIQFKPSTAHSTSYR